MRRNANSDFGAWGTTVSANARNASGKSAIIALITRMDTVNRKALVDWTVTKSTASATSSVAMAFDLFQYRSLSVTPSDASESRMNPVDGVTRARATSDASRGGRPGTAGTARG